MFIDTHAHIYLPEFDSDRDLVVENAQKNGVHKILLPNIDSNTIDAMLNLSEKHPGICYPMIGLHPTHVKDNYQYELKVVEHYLEKGNFIAIGETGIDLYWDKTFVNEQIDSFTYQINLAKKNNLPIVIHVRNSFEEVFEVLDKHYDENLKGVFHCFTGNLQQAQKIIEYNFKLGIGGVLTFKNSNLNEVIERVEPRHLILETDSPYLAPVPNRGKRNESANIKHIAEKLSEIKNLTIEDIAEITTTNAKQLFNI